MIDSLVGIGRLESKSSNASRRVNDILNDFREARKDSVAINKEVDREMARLNVIRKKNQGTIKLVNNLLLPLEK